MAQWLSDWQLRSVRFPHGINIWMVVVAGLAVCVCDFPKFVKRTHDTEIIPSIEKRFFFLKKACQLQLKCWKRFHTIWNRQIYTAKLNRIAFYNLSNSTRSIGCLRSRVPRTRRSGSEPWLQRTKRPGILTSTWLSSFIRTLTRRLTVHLSRHRRTAIFVAKPGMR